LEDTHSKKTYKHGLTILNGMGEWKHEKRTWVNAKTEVRSVVSCRGWNIEDRVQNESGRKMRRFVEKTQIRTTTSY